MSGRSNFIKRALRQTAVYWGGAVSDGAGGRTFDDAIEIPCRWSDKTEVIIDASGREITSTAMVIVDRTLDVGGYLFKGGLADLTPAQVHDAFQVSGSREIRKVETVPGLHDDTVTVRRAWL